MTENITRRGDFDYTADGVWRLQATVIRRFYETEQDYIALCGEVAYIVQKAVERVGVDTASITWRSKSLTSFLEKIQRKTYGDPFIDLTDRAGVRVVCHYESDCRVVVDALGGVFDVLETEDKVSKLGTDRFGYGARHLLVRLGDRFSGARYDDLRDLKCEIQVRTVLQDAWAVLEHHLFYKSEDRIPTELIRTINSLAAQLEYIDHGFEGLREQQQLFLEKVRASRIDGARFLLNELTLATFDEYLKWRFPSRPIERSEGQVRRVLADMNKSRFRLLLDVDKAVAKFENEIVEVGHAVDSIDLEDGELRPSVYDVAWAVALEDPAMMAGTGLPLHWRDALIKVREH